MNQSSLKIVEIHLNFRNPFEGGWHTMRIQCRIVAGVAVAGLALFTQIQLVLRLPRHRRIDHNLGNTGNVRIHKKETHKSGFVLNHYSACPSLHDI